MTFNSPTAGIGLVKAFKTHADVKCRMGTASANFLSQGRAILCYNSPLTKLKERILRATCRLEGTSRSCGC